MEVEAEVRRGHTQQQAKRKIYNHVGFYDFFIR
jgi:hypothetical protein